MNDKEYLKRMIKLTEDLNRAASAEPFDKDDWQSALDEYHSVNLHWLLHRHRLSKCAIALILLILSLLTVFAFLLNHGYAIRGP
jgi:hypothetical protein